MKNRRNKSRNKPKGKPNKTPSTTLRSKPQSKPNITLNLQQWFAKIDDFLHPQEVLEARWRLLPYLLLVAFVVRAAVALSGDFVIHPDEVMQYLEPAHELVFGSGVIFWEYFYGARSWLVPSFIAAVLWVCKVVGLGDSPDYYIAVVKLVFCAVSLLIPWGMYMFCRRHWGEQSARVALVFGVFWYELAAFAHKPMTEFVATSLLFALLAVMPLSSTNWRRAMLTGALCALIVAVRMQYILPLGFLFLASLWAVDNKERVAMFFGGVVMLLVVGLMEFLTWGAPFHSYYVNVMMNLIIAPSRQTESSPFILLLWLLLASSGLIVAMVWGLLEKTRRRIFVLVLMSLILIPHMLQPHREYRFIFATIPMWLILFADFVAVAGLRYKRPAMWSRTAYALIGVVSVLGIFNTLPLQNTIYTGFSSGSGEVNFVRDQDPIFAIYRKLNADESVRGIIDYARFYMNTPGYYYLHRKLPFYDRMSWEDLEEKRSPEKYASHIIAGASAENIKVVKSSNEQGSRMVLQTEHGFITLPMFVHDISNQQLVYWDENGKPTRLPKYKLQESFAAGGLVGMVDGVAGGSSLVGGTGFSGGTSLWKIDEDTPVQQWKKYRTFPIYDVHLWIMKQIEKSPLPLPPKHGIEFVKN